MTPTEASTALPGTANQELPTIIQVTYGDSRDHREDLKQWMLALNTSGDGVPQFLRPLDGQASDKRSLLDAVITLTEQLKASGETPGVYVADSGLYCTENMPTLNTAGVPWASRVPETTTAAQAMVDEEPSAWQTTAEGTRQWWSRVVVRTKGGSGGSWCAQRRARRARATLQRQAERDLASWTKRLWHLGNATFACQADAEVALARALTPPRVGPDTVSGQNRYSKQAKPGRPRKDVVPATQVWQIRRPSASRPMPSKPRRCGGRPISSGPICWMRRHGPTRR